MHCNGTRKSATEKRHTAYAKAAQKMTKSRVTRGRPMVIEINIKNLPKGALAKVSSPSKDKGKGKKAVGKKTVVKRKSPSPSPSRSVNSNMNKFSNSNNNRNIYN